MKDIFVNLKRFDVPRDQGGVCPMDNPALWIAQVMAQSIELGLGKLPDVKVTYLVPEALIVPAQEALARCSAADAGNLSVGCQGVYRENIRKGGSFGAFTTLLPAASAYQLGVRTAIIGHSEERRDKQRVIAAFEPGWNEDETLRGRCLAAVDSLIHSETLRALEQGIDVLLCMGETAEERGEGSFEEQQARVRAALSGQVERGLAGVRDFLPERRVVIGYEPIWAIGPGKTPPGKDYIAFVSAFIKEKAMELYSLDIPVVYGGGLKEENAAMIASIPSIDGGLVALTRFSGEIGFYTDELKAILEQYTR